MTCCRLVEPALLYVGYLKLQIITVHQSMVIYLGQIVFGSLMSTWCVLLLQWTIGSDALICLLFPHHTIYATVIMLNGQAIACLEQFGIPYSKKITGQRPTTPTEYSFYGNHSILQSESPPDKIILTLPQVEIRPYQIFYLVRSLIFIHCQSGKFYTAGESQPII